MLDFLNIFQLFDFPDIPKIYYAVLFLTGYVSYYLLEVVKPPLFVCADGPFRDFIVEHVDLVKKKFWPTFWCFESRAQTIVACALRGKVVPNIPYRREILRLKDGGEVALDWSDDNCSATSPIVIILPGITGSSQAGYIKSLVTGARDSGIRCVVFNNRGLGGISLKTPRVYCAANCEDFAEVLDHARKSFPNVPIGATGISMGGIILGNYLAQGKMATEKLSAAFIISAPWNIFEATKSSESGINIMLNRHLANSLATNLKRMHYSTESGLFQQEIIDRLDHSKTVREFDESFTVKSFGYKDIDDYYESATLHNKLHLIEVPLLCLSAADDPFQLLPAIPLKDASLSRNIAFVITTRGGHIGFLEGIWPSKNKEYMTLMFTQFFTGIFQKGFKLTK